MANQVKSKYARTRMRYDNIQKAKVKSQLENKQRPTNHIHLIGSFWHIWQLLAMNIMMPVSSQR
jgi:hypothetical protein